MEVANLSAVRTGRLYPYEASLIFIYARGWVDPWAIVRPEMLNQWKPPIDPSVIEPGTFRLVAQCLNQLCQSVFLMKEAISHLYLLGKTVFIPHPLLKDMWFVRGSYRKWRAIIFCKVTCFIIETKYTTLIYITFFIFPHNRHFFVLIFSSVLEVWKFPCGRTPFKPSEDTDALLSELPPFSHL